MGTNEIEHEGKLRPADSEQQVTGEAGCKINFNHIQPSSRPASEILEELRKGLRNHPNGQKITLSLTEPEKIPNSRRTVFARCMLFVKSFFTGK